MMNDRKRGLLARFRLLFGLLVLLVPTACTGGINAGVKGGQAFIVFTGMLLVTLGILWLVLGREK